jgi:hypothetical protein
MEKFYDGLQNKIKEEYIIWLTGFFEGEGSCGYYHHSCWKGGRLIISISQKEREVLDEIKATVGFGYVGIQNKRNGIAVAHCYTTSMHKAEYLLRLFLPYIRSTKKRIQILTSLAKWYNRPIGISRETKRRWSRIRRVQAKTALRDKLGRFVIKSISIESR